MSNIKTLVNQITKKLGKDIVITDQRQLQLAAMSISEHQSRSILAIIKPNQCEQVAELLELLDAAEGLLSVYPISSGKNWGYGSKNPVSDNAVLLDLSGLNRIIDIDLDKGIAFIEAGVSQGQLSEAIVGSNYKLNMTNSAKESSIVGNALERGIGTSRHRVEDIIGFEVLLGTGQTMQVGGLWPVSGEIENAFHYPHGIGPNLMPLFFQSNFAIVTKAAVSLIPKAQQHSLISCSFAEHQLTAVYTFIRSLYDQNILNTYFKIYDNRAASTYRLPQSDNADYLLYGSLETSDDFADILKPYLIEKFEQSALFVETNIYPQSYFEDLPWSNIEKLIFETFKGNNNVSGFIKDLFAVNHVEQVDEEGQMGWLFFVPVIPAEASALLQALAILDEYSKNDDFILSTSIKCPPGKCIDLNVSIRFARVPAQIKAAHQLLDNLHNEFESNGFYNYRYGIDHQQTTNRFTDEVYWSQLKGLKQLFDPNNVIAPQRYINLYANHNSGESHECSC